MKEERPFTIFKPPQDILDCFNAIEKEYMIGPYGIKDLTSFVQYMVMENAMYAANIAQKNASCKSIISVIDYGLIIMCVLQMIPFQENRSLFKLIVTMEISQ